MESFSGDYFGDKKRQKLMIDSIREKGEKKELRLTPNFLVWVTGKMLVFLGQGMMSLSKNTKWIKTSKEGIVHNGKTIRKVSKEVEVTASCTSKTGHMARL